MRHLSPFVLAVFTAMIGVSTMAQEPTPAAEDPQKRIDAIKKEIDLLEAQKKLVEAQKALAEAQKPLAANADQIAAAKTAKELADAQKALADARKAESDANLAAFKAALGEVPASGISGAVDAKENAGEVEASLLAMKAVREAAEKVAASVRKGAGTSSRRIVVLSSSEAPTFANLVAYDTEVAVVRELLRAAIAAAQPPPEVGPKLEAVPLLGAAGVTLDAVSKLLSFFRSDYVVKGVTVSLADKDALALHAVAGALAAQGQEEKALEVSVPTIYDPTTLASSAGFFIEDVKELAVLRGQAQELDRKLASTIASLKKALEDEKNSTTRAALEAEIAKRVKLSTGLQSAAALMDAWYTKLGTPDSKGVAALVHVAREKALASEIKRGHLLVVKLQTTGGGYMTKKNLWTFFGGMPLYHMGGAGLSYTLVHGTTGLVEVSGVVPIHGGFVKAGRLRTELGS